MEKIVVQIEDFDLTTEVSHTRNNDPQIGAIVSCIGTVRDLHPGSISSLTLEHYPEMTEKSLKSIVTEARERWDLQNVTIIHRIGKLKVNDQIVLVVATSKHRQAAFESCYFIMDYLKKDAPFWKKEYYDDDYEWLENTRLTN